MVCTLTLNNAVAKPLSFIKSGYNNGEIASELFPVGKSKPNEEAISPKELTSIDGLASGAIAVSLVYVLGTQRMI